MRKEGAKNGMKSYRHERGQSFLEYALILILVVIVILLIFRLLGPAIERLYQNVIQTV